MIGRSAHAGRSDAATGAIKSPPTASVCARLSLTRVPAVAPRPALTRRLAAVRPSPAPDQVADG